MNSTAAAFAILLLMWISASGAERDYSKLAGPEITEIAFRQVKEADFVIDYLTHLDKYDLGIGKVENNVIDSVLLDQEQIEPFFASQKHRVLIVVVFRKNTWEAEKRENKIMEINESLFRAGFQRVVIQQGYGSGRGIWSDKDGPKAKEFEQDGADQPATGPESKSEGDEKPKPESEGRSR